MTSAAYWHPRDKPDSEDTLIYIPRHGGCEASEEFWSLERV